MITQTPRSPFTLDPLIAEAKQRTRRRRLLLAAIVVLVSAGSAGGVIAARSATSTNATALGHRAETRSCGILGVGIGWHVSTGFTVSCSSGMPVMRSYFDRDRANTTVTGYTCTSHHVGGRIICTRGRSAVTAVANH